MASDEEIAAILARIEAIEERLGMAGAPKTPPTTVTEAARPSPGAARHPLPGGEGLETRIGAHWLNRVGIAAVLFGAAFFLKYAFDNNWVGPAMRVAIGAGVGVALLVWGESLRARGHELFAHTLDILGAGILYLTI